MGVNGNLPALCGGTLTVTYTLPASDPNNCTGADITETCDITVLPPAPPTITTNCPASITCAEAQNYSAPDATYDNGEMGACQIMGTVMGVNGTLPGLCGGMLTVTYTLSADDPRNCTGADITETCEITVEPPAEPTIDNNPGPLTIECGTAPPTGTVVTFSNGESGACEISGEIMGVITGMHDACGGTYTETWTFPSADNCDRGDIVETRTITVNPASAPTATNPGDITIENEDAPPVGTVLTFSNGESGECEITEDVVGIISGSHDACSGEYTETWTFEYCEENTSSARRLPQIVISRVITVNPTDPPSIDCSAASDLILDCDENDSLEIAAWLELTITQLEAATTSAAEFSISHDYDFDNVPELSCGLTSGVDVTFTLIDECDRTATCVKTIFRDDSVNPFWTSPLPSDIEIECGTDVDDVPWPEVSAEDLCDDDVEINRSSTSRFAGCGGEVIIRTFTAIDDCGNRISASYEIDMTDNLPPVLIVPGDTIVPCSAEVDSGYIVTDNCSSVSVTVSDEREDINECEYIITRTWTAVDGCGNRSSATRIISFADMQAPVISLVPELAALVNEDGNMVMYGCDIPVMPMTGALVTDDCCIPNELVTFDRLVAKNVCDVFGFHTRYRCGYKVTDAAGNTTVLAFDVFQYDTTAPVIMNLPPDIQLSCSELVPPADTNAVFADDGCARNLERSFTENTVVNPDDPNQMATLRTWSFADDCGNQSSATQTISLCDFALTTDTYSKVGNTVWFDADSNGVQDSGEKGINDVKLKLYLDSGAGSALVIIDSTYSSTKSSIDGQYGFEFLLDGQYALQVEVPVGYLLTKANVNENDNDQRDSDADEETGMIFGISVRNGTVLNHLDIGFIHDVDFEDPTEDEVDEEDDLAGEGGIKEQEDAEEKHTEIASEELRSTSGVTATLVPDPVRILSATANPNPTSGRVQLDFESTLTTKSIIVVRDNYGSIVRKYDVEATEGFNRLELNLEELPSGLYLIQIRLDGEQKLMRVVKN